MKIYTTKIHYNLQIKICLISLLLLHVTSNYIMAYKQKNECSTHRIKLCPENKLIVKKKQAEINHQCDISVAVNQIITEWNELKNKKK